MSPTKVASRRPTSKSVVETFREHLVLKSEAATIVTRSERLKKSVKEWLAGNFAYENEKGSKFFDLPETIRDLKGVSYSGMELRKSEPTPVFEDYMAEKILKKRGVLELALSTYIDQDKVYLLVQQEKISESDLDKMFSTPEPTWSFWPVKGEVE